LKSERIILGVDPGTNIMGYGLISCKDNQISLIQMNVLKLNKLTDHALKLKKIFETTLSIIAEYHPDELAIEAPFFGKNVQSMLKLGRAQGVAIAAALSKEIPYCEYSPRKIKQSITGNGSASKEQVAGMLASILNFKDAPQYLDESDAVAVAVCHFFQNKNISQGESFSGWKAFLAKNPDRKI
jgi:crossover junction endodeoxyribonuclease RuvC